jgi:hypothetical protein
MMGELASSESARRPGMSRKPSISRVQPRLAHQALSPRVRVICRVEDAFPVSDPRDETSVQGEAGRERDGLDHDGRAPQEAQGQSHRQSSRAHHRTV